MDQRDALIGILALLAADREERVIAQAKSGAELRRTEVVLADAGIAPAHIAQLLDKKPNSVLKTIARARAKTGGKE